MNTTRNFLFLILNLDTVLSDSTSENFANNWQNKWNWIRAMNFETAWIHFLSDFFSLLSSRNFTTMVTWRNDFSLSNYVLFKKRAGVLLSGLKTRGEAESFSNRQYTIARFLNCFKISDIHCRSTHSCISVQILGYFGLQNWTQSLAVYLSDIKTLIKHYFHLFNEFLKSLIRLFQILSLWMKLPFYLKSFIKQKGPCRIKLEQMEI